METIFTFYYSYSGKKIRCEIFNPSNIIKIELVLKKYFLKKLSSPSQKSIDAILEKSKIITN